jgi:hypothetical protein
LIVAALVVAGVLLAGALGMSRDQRRGQEPTTPERVFLTDMAQQTADARQLVTRAGPSAGVTALASRIERQDHDVLGDARVVPSQPLAAEAGSDPDALRAALRRHISEDRIIARVELATGTSARVKDLAARLLEHSRTWVVPAG